MIDETSLERIGHLFDLRKIEPKFHTVVSRRQVFRFDQRGVYTVETQLFDFGEWSCEIEADLILQRPT